MEVRKNLSYNLDEFVLRCSFNRFSFIAFDGKIIKFIINKRKHRKAQYSAKSSIFSPTFARYNNSRCLHFINKNF